MMRTFVALSACVTFLSGCASQIMESYVGRDLTAAIVDYGPPAAQFEMPDGRMAFQWTITSTYVTPTTTNFSTTSYGSRTYGFAQSTGGVPITDTCRYTAYAEQQGERWIITGFEEPSFWCS